MVCRALRHALSLSRDHVDQRTASLPRPAVVKMEPLEGGDTLYRRQYPVNIYRVRIFTVM